MNPAPTAASPHWAFTALRRLAEAAMALSLLGMVLAVFLNVLLRYVFNTGLAISEELSRLLFVWLVCIGAILALAEGKHLGFDMVTSRLRGLPATLCRWLTRGLIGVALYYLVTGSWQQVLAGMNSRSPVMNYPLALAAAGTLVMGLCMAVLLVIECLRALRHGETPREPA
jgi:TRAP-type C4-dicarboxylate transport system permease small subunit